MPTIISADRFYGNGWPIDGRATLLHVAKRERERTPFGQRIYDARKHAGLTQTQLANACGLAQSTLGELEVKGESSMRTVQIAEACGVRAQWLADGSGPMVDVRRLPPEVEELAAEMIALPKKQRDWVLMTLREAVKLAKETVAPLTPDREEAVTRSGSANRRAA